VLLPKGTSEEAVTGGALGGKGSPKLGVMGTSEDRGDGLTEVSPSVGPRGRDGVNEVK